MTTYTFPEQRVTAKRTFTCEVCGKRGTAQRTFMATENPFNKNPDGSIRTRSEVRAQAQAKADAWQPQPVHPKCEDDE